MLEGVAAWANDKNKSESQGQTEKKDEDYSLVNRSTSFRYTTACFTVQAVISLSFRLLLVHGHKSSHVARLLNSRNVKHHKDG